MMKYTVACLLLLVASVSATSFQLSFQKDQELSYLLNGTLHARSAGASDQIGTEGASTAIRARMVIRCEGMENSLFKFTMNMYDAEIDDKSLPTKVTKKFDQNLGKSAQFWQQADGQVVRVVFQTDDSDYYKQVKLGAINALHSHIVPAGSTHDVADSDAVGMHKSAIIASTLTSLEEGESVHLNLYKTFDQTMFTQFTDANLKPHNIKLNAKTTTKVHQNGYIMSSVVDQAATLTNINEQPGDVSTTTDLSKRSAPEAVDMYMTSSGKLSLKLMSPPTLSSSASVHTLAFDSQDVQEGTLFEHSVRLSNIVDQTSVVDELKFLYDLQTPQTQVVKKMDALIRKLNASPASTVVLKPHLETLSQSRDPEVVASRLFYILSGVDHIISEKYLVAYGLRSSEKISERALLAVHSSKHSGGMVTSYLVRMLLGDDVTVAKRESILLAVGSSASRCNSKTARKILLQEMNNQNDARKIEVCLHAIHNAGSKLFGRDDVIALAQMYSNHPQLRVRNALSVLINGNVFSAENSDYPINRTKQVEYSLGGSSVRAEFQAGLFLGTNFNCKNKNFNLKAEASASVDVELFSRKQRAVDADATYGQANGLDLADTAFIKVWGKVFKNIDLPRASYCPDDNYPLYHAAPGFSVSYTLWVSIIPMSFQASASLVLDLNLELKACTTDLSLSVNLTPTVSLVVMGSAEINLLVLKAGIDLNGEINSAIIPEAFVDGTLCTAGLDVSQHSEPMSVTLEAYAQWKKCHILWIFDCEWGTQQSKDLLSWSLAESDKQLWSDKYSLV